MTYFLAIVALGMRAASTFSLRECGAVMPRATAAHFCQLMVCDNNGNIQSLNSYIHRQPSDDTDSLSFAQSFCTYIFNYGGWQSLRIFPHTRTNGNITWYAAEDRLPDDVDSEHQKYIHDVFPRLIAEIEAENWSQVDAYIDRMLEYQTTFASLRKPSPDTSRTSPVILFLLFALFLAFPLFSSKKSQQMKKLTE